MLSLLLAASLEFTPQDAHLAYESARRLVETCTPRDAGSFQGAIAANRILDAASASGADVRRDSFLALTPKGERRFTNLYAEFRHGGDDEGWVVLLSHYDTKPGCGCPGANDGASTTGLLIGLANMLYSCESPTGNVMLVWTDGEESMEAYGDLDGFWGSKRAVRHVQALRRKIKAAVCLDMLGDRDLAISIPANGSKQLAEAALAAARKAGYPNLVRRVRETVKDDHVAFLDAGFPAIDLIDFSYGPNNSYWHTPQDTMDKVSEESLLKSGRIVAELLNGIL